MYSTTQGRGPRRSRGRCSQPRMRSPPKPLKATSKVCTDVRGVSAGSKVASRSNVFAAASVPVQNASRASGSATSVTCVLSAESGRSAIGIGDVPVDEWSGGGVELEVPAEELAVRRRRFDGACVPRPVGTFVDETAGDGGEQRVAVGGADCLLGNGLGKLGDVGDDLRPERALCPSAGCSDLPRGAVSRRVLEAGEYVPDAECGRLVHGAHQVRGSMTELEPDDDAARTRIEEGASFTREVRQHE